MNQKGYEEFIKKYDERIEKMTDEEFAKYCEKMGLVKKSEDNSNNKTK